LRIVAMEPLGVPDKRLNEIAAPLIERGHTVRQYHDRVEDLMDMIGRCREADALIVVDQILPGKLLEACPNIRMISIASEYRDQVDLQKARMKVVPVCKISEYWTYSVAELTVALLLAVKRRIVPSDAAARGKQPPESIEGHEIFGKTVGIIGTGSVGLHVARIMKAFGCELLAYSRTHKKEAEVWTGLEYVSLEELLTRSDIVSLHLPLNSGTEGFLSTERIAMMKQGAILVNTAHIKLMDCQAVSELLKSGWLAGAGVDAFDSETPLGGNHPLAKAPNVVMTPRSGAATPEALEKRAWLALENIMAWMDGKPKGVVA